MNAVLDRPAIDRSTLFVSYNVCRRLAHQGYLDEKRLNRALGLAQRKGAPKYHTTVDSCDCPDSTYRGRSGVTCKHRLALALREMAGVS